MKKRTLVIAVAINGLATLLLAKGIYAGVKVPEVIHMSNKAYTKHTRKIVEFHHKKHQAEYAQKNPEFFSAGCGECHHDKNHKPLTNLKVGDVVQGCIECHTKPDVMTDAEKRAVIKLSKKEKKSKLLEYHAEAVMMNCLDCHKKYNKKNNLNFKDKGYAPATCVKCHMKK